MAGASDRWRAPENQAVGDEWLRRRLHPSLLRSLNAPDQHVLDGHSHCPRNFSRYPRSRASWTNAIVVWAAFRARFVPSAKASRTSPILAAKRARRSRIGSREVLSAAASFCFTSTSPTAPRRYRSLRSATSSRLGLNASWYRNTGLPSTWPGSVARSRVGSVYIERTFSSTTGGVSWR